MKDYTLLTILLGTMLLTAGCTTSPAVDKLPPKDIDIMINPGHNYTTSRNVQLKVHASDPSGIKDMAFSDDGTNWSAWMPYSESVSYNLSQGDGVKKVYFKARDKAGNEATPVSATIIMDTVLPEVIKATPGIEVKDAPFDSRIIALDFSEDIEMSISGCPLNFGIKNMGDIFIYEYSWKTRTHVECRITEDLRPDTTYSIRFNENGIISAQDVAGNAAKARNWTFTTRAAKFETVSKNVYHPPGEQGTLIFGELKNVDTYGFIFVHYDMTAYDASHNKLFTGDATIEHYHFQIVRPGEVMPFAWIFPDKDGLIKDVDIIAGGNSDYREAMTSEIPYDKVQISNATGHFDSSTDYSVHGDVKNVGGKMANSTAVIASFYDSSHKLVAVSDAGIQNLGPGMSVSFEVHLYNSQADITKIAEYKLITSVG